MGLIRPATPGFFVTLIATILLLVVSFSVPWFKSVYFLKAAVTERNQTGFITFGVLGYCTSVNNGTLNCTKAQLGYRFDANELLGNNVKFLQIPSVVTSWITWALVLHIVALVIAAISTLFGLLAHVREMAMSCLSTCISGFAASVALLAFIFDLVLVFTARARINSIQGGSAQIGSGVWLTLAAWVLLFFSGCFYAIGRCCVSTRPRVPGGGGNKWNIGGQESQKDSYAEQMRLDAVKAEADRKARQARPEVGLPAFPGTDERKPLSTNYEPAYLEEEVPLNPYKDNSSSPALGGSRPLGPRSPQRQGTGHSSVPSDNSNGNYGSSAYATGYTPGQQGRRTIDQYNAVSPPPVPNTYPPQSPSRTPARQPTLPSEYEGRHERYPAQVAAPANDYRGYQQPSQNGYSSQPYEPYTQSNSAAGAAAAYGSPGRVQSPPYGQTQYLEPTANYGHNQYPTGSTQDYGHGYGHSQDNSAYYSAVSHGQGQEPSQTNNYPLPSAYQSQTGAYTGYGDTQQHQQPSIPMPSAASTYPQYPGASYPTAGTPPANTQYYSSVSAQQQQQQPTYNDPYSTPSPQQNAAVGGNESYFPYQRQPEPSNAYQRPYQSVPGGLHTVQEASDSTTEEPPQYSRGGNPPPAGWAVKS